MQQAQQAELFRLALGLVEPWLVKNVEFDPKESCLTLTLDFQRGAKFACPECRKTGLPVHDTAEKKWRHMDFFQHEAWLHARVPRVNCEECGVRLANVPWARPGSGFTLLFEALVMTLAPQMTVKAAARMFRETDTRLWRVILAYVKEARKKADHSRVEAVGMDETASRRGHKYVSLFVDLKERYVLFATPGKDQTTVDRFREDLIAHGGDPAVIREAASDMSEAFTAGIRENLPNARLTYDKFHAIKLVSDAVDETRREEVASRPELVGTRYVWLKNTLNLTEHQLATWDRLKDANLKTVKAYELSLAFKEIWFMPLDQARLAIGRWISWGLRSRIEAMKRVAKTLRTRVPEILRVLENDFTTAILEGINSLVQAARAKARGYRNVEYFIAIIYLIAGHLDLHVTHSK